MKRSDNLKRGYRHTKERFGDPKTRTMKICGRCRERKVLSEFNKNRNAADGLQNRCRECDKYDSCRYYRSKARFIIMAFPELDSVNPITDTAFVENVKNRLISEGYLEMETSKSRDIAINMIIKAQRILRLKCEKKT